MGSGKALNFAFFSSSHSVSSCVVTLRRKFLLSLFRSSVISLSRFFSSSSFSFHFISFWLNHVSDVRACVRQWECKATKWDEICYFFCDFASLNHHRKFIFCVSLSLNVNKLFVLPLSKVNEWLWGVGIKQTNFCWFLQACVRNW